MARYQFADDEDARENSRAERIATLAVRGIGLVLLVVGLMIALRVILEAWWLYGDPARIERLAAAIERGSHIDASLAPRRTPAPPSNPLDGGLDPVAPPAPQPVEPPALQPAEAPAPPAFRLSYFAAWAIALLLLLLIGRLALAAIKTGAELALYDLKLRRSAKA